MPTPMNPDVKAVGDVRSHRHHMKRLGSLTPYSMSYEDFRGSPFFTPEATRETMEGTQFEGENHRRITPYVLEMMMGRVRGDLINALDRRVDSETNLFPFSQGSQFDVAIIGSGPHGAAVAAYLREKRPDLTTVIIEANPMLGGQWRSYGPKPVFQMNSRVRKADRRLPALPRTDGSINPLGKFAPLELSDIPTGVYPWNTDMGNVCAINSFLSATTTLVNTKVTRVEQGYDYVGDRENRVLYLDTQSGEKILRANVVIDATGLQGRSQVVNYEKNATPDGYFTARTFYEHFAQDANPLERFHNANIVVVGRGDSALTVLEALIGNLPTSTYGRSGVGRNRPRRIDWLGAYSSFAPDIQTCLRTRYKNGIVQSLRRNNEDEGGMIVPNTDQVRAIRRGGDPFFDVEIDSGRLLFPNVVIDCTNRSDGEKYARDYWNPNYFVGPESGGSLSDRTRRKIDELGISENIVSLWATMQKTDNIGAAIARSLNV